MTTAPAEPRCEHCGAEGPVSPTPHGFHCGPCYEQAMGEAEQEPHNCDGGNIYED
ncbi:hypothetical protein VPH49_21390 [Pseudomonas luteola]|uniref:hypothetical protein n=1 Tax=Pseudomonas luteola TaxID=47886 RepID=UPI00142EE00C|nr:hypothetical protein [Pseudomonas luteola]